MSTRASAATATSGTAIVAILLRVRDGSEESGGEHVELGRRRRRCMKVEMEPRPVMTPMEAPSRASTARCKVSSHE